MEEISRSDEAIGQVTGQRKSSRRGVVLVLGLIGLLLAIWFLLRPGVFTVQPIGAIPDGVTFIYHSRGLELPLFSSPDGLCLQMQGSVNLLCRGAALAGVVELTDRILVRLPYSHWAYLQSTGGLEFDG